MEISEKDVVIWLVAEYRDFCNFNRAIDNGNDWKYCHVHFFNWCLEQVLERDVVFSSHGNEKHEVVLRKYETYNSSNPHFLWPEDRL